MASQILKNSNAFSFRERRMIYYCPRAFSEDCNADKCSHYATKNCVDGQVRANIASEPSSQVISCPRANSSDCSEAKCTLWGSAKCSDGRVNIEFEF